MAGLWLNGAPMITRTSKVCLRQQLRRMREQMYRHLRQGKYAKYQYARDWIKAHSKLLKEDAARSEENNVAA